MDDDQTREDALRHPSPASALKGLLHAFKAARTQRDEAPYGSSDWAEADGDLQGIQREIFELSFEEPVGASRHEQRGLANLEQDSGTADEPGHADGPGPPEPPPAI